MKFYEAVLKFLVPHMMHFIQGLHEKFDDIVMAIGSGGTACGLAVANYLTGSRLKYVTILDSSPSILIHP